MENAAMEIRPLSTIGGHIPVMAQEVLEALAPLEGGRVIDGTAGLGGHTRLIALKVGAKGRVWAFEKDPVTRAKLQEHMAPFPHVEIVPKSFDKMLEVVDAGSADGVLLDLGLSSYLLEASGRGFSFRKPNEVLDMRFNPEEGLPLYQRWFHITPQTVGHLLRVYGEIRGWKRLGMQIHRAKPRTVGELNKVVLEVFPWGGTKLLRKVYQAFRIWVNDELCVLRRGLEASWKTLRPGGRLVVLSYHSLEDRCVKQMKEVPGARVLFPQGKTPSPTEVQHNPRARSARLRAFQKEGNQDAHMDDWDRYLARCPCGL